MNGKNLLLRVMLFFECRFHVISKTCGIGDIKFFVCHETTYNRVIKELCYLVHGGPVP